MAIKETVQTKIGKFILTNKVKRIVEIESFGDLIELDGVPEDCNAFIICVNIYGLKPVRLCLPHQLYVETIENIIEKNPGAGMVTVIPVRSKDYIDVAGYNHYMDKNDKPEKIV